MDHALHRLRKAIHAVFDPLHLLPGRPLYLILPRPNQPHQSHQGSVQPLLEVLGRLQETPPQEIVRDGMSGHKHHRVDLEHIGNLGVGKAHTHSQTAHRELVKRVCFWSEGAADF